MSGENPFFSVIRIWAAMAWADGKISREEATAMRRLIDGANLSDQEKEAARGLLAEKVELDTANVGALSAEARHGIYRAAVKLAHIDKDFAEAEKLLLGRLREGLQIDPHTAADIEKAAAAK